MMPKAKTAGSLAHTRVDELDEADGGPFVAVVHHPAGVNGAEGLCAPRHNLNKPALATMTSAL